MTFFSVAPMDLFSPYHPIRDRVLTEVEHFFGSLSPHLLRQGMIVQHELATAYSESGQFRDILARPHDYPLLYWHLWLLDDLALSGSEKERRRFEEELLAGMLYAFMAAFIQERVLEERSSIDHRFLFLAQVLSQKSHGCFERLFPPTHPFWRYYWQCLQEYAESSLWVDAGRGAQATALLQEDQVGGRRLALGTLPFLAVGALGTSDRLLGELMPIIEPFNQLFQTLNELSTIRRDLALGRQTYVIRRILQAAGISPEGPVSPERLLGALLLTGVGAQLCEECLTRLRVCRSNAALLPLPRFDHYFDLVEARLQQVKALLSLRGASKAASLPGFFVPAPPPLEKAIDMAERYLLSDLTFRESWEVLREGLFGQPEVVGRAFPAGLVLEILCEHGHDLGEQVDSIFERLHANRFRYYDYPVGQPDADDLGLLLRLHRYTTDPAKYRTMLETPLRWMEESIAPSGKIPVWFTTDEGPDEHEVILWGGQCATVEINLLLGLLAYDAERYRSIIERATTALIDRFLRVGLGAVAYYTPLASLWLLSELMTRVSPGKASALQGLIDEHLAQATWYQGTPQDAAFHLLADDLRKNRALQEPTWLSTLLRHQRYDGSWLGEPLYICPSQGRATTWYSSTTVTTAMCYHALKRYAGRHTN